MEGITRYQMIADDQISVSTRNKEHRKDRFPSCSSSSSCDTLNMENTDDAYHEDGLPDLVLDHQLGSHLTLNDNPVLNIKVNEENHKVADICARYGSSKSLTASRLQIKTDKHFGHYNSF